MLNSEQIKAINHFKGPGLVLAGPGSGKTTVIANRVKWLVEEKCINPNSILVLTFTKSAAINMKKRYVLLTENKVDSEKLTAEHPELQGFKTDDRRLFLTEVKKPRKERDEAKYIVDLIKMVHGYAK